MTKELTEAQKAIILDMYMRDPEVQSLIKDKITKRMEEAKAMVAGLSGFAGSGVKPGRKPNAEKSHHAGPGSRGHKEKILTALRAKPGMKVGELREALAKKGHEIDNKSLNTLIYLMKKSNEIKSTGEKFSSQLFVA
jgi:hypothetical protein